MKKNRTIMKSTLIFLSCSAWLAGCSSAQKSSSSTPSTKAPARQEKSESASKSSKSDSKQKSSSESAKSASDAVKETVCSHGNEQRTISITTGPSGCKVIYTKGGETKEIASARNQIEYCNNAFDKVKKNLSSGGYNCE